MDKLTDSSLSKLQKLLQSHQEKNSLYLKIKFNQHQNLQKIKIIEEELSKLTHLTDLTLHISKYSILTADGYLILSNAVINLISLKSLSIKIDESCFLENEGLSILQGMINHLPELINLKFEIRANNYITSEAGQKFLDSLSANTKLQALDLDFNEIRRSEDENIHFWRGLSNLNNNLETLNLSLNSLNFGYQDLIELFTNLPNLIKIRNLSLLLNSDYKGDVRILDELFPQIGKMTDLRSLLIDDSTYDMALNNAQRKEIIRNLSNLKSLQKLKLRCIEEHLCEEIFDEYMNFIKNLKDLQELSLIIGEDIQNHNQIISLGETLLELKNLVTFEFYLTPEDNDIWREFFQDLSQSLKQMNNLLNLQIGFTKQISEKGSNILGDSLEHLQRLEKLGLDIGTSDHYKNTTLLQNICKVRNLKELRIQSDNFNLEKFFESIISLSQLEKLHLRRFSNCSNQDTKSMEALCNTLMNLRRLKSLECFFFIKTLENQDQLDLLEKAFENLSELEDLKLSLIIEERTSKQKKISLTKNLINLKRIEVDFQQKVLNIFGSSSKKQKYQLEVCSLTLASEMKAPKFLQILESLSQFSLKKLDLEIYISENQDKQLLFEKAFSKLNSLEKLMINDKKIQKPINYLHGIKQLKALSTLSLQFDTFNVTQEDSQMLFQTLTSLTNLQKMSFSLRYGVYAADLSDISQLNSLKPFRNLRSIYLNCFLQVNDKVFHRYIIANQPRLLNLDEQKQSNLKDNGVDPHELYSHTHEIMQNQCLPLQTQKQLDNQKENSLEKTEDQYLPIQLQQQIDNQKENNLEKMEDQCQPEQPQQLQIENQKEDEENSEVDSGELNTTSMQLTLGESNVKQGSFSLNAFDFNKSLYLNQLLVTISFYSNNPIKLELLTPLRDLQCESRLTSLILTLDYLILSEDQISYFSRNLKHFSNLQKLHYITSCFQDYYHILFDSFSHLTNLNELRLQINISENGAILLGNSLKAMKKLQTCQLFFIESSTCRFEGMYSIFSGLKQITSLVDLNLEMQTDQMAAEEDCYIPLSECISNSKFLQQIYFRVAIDHINPNCWRDSMISIGSLVFLSSLGLDIKEANAFDQETLDELIKSLNKLRMLNNYSISIYLQQGSEIILSQEFATLFNTVLPNCQLVIDAQENEVAFQESSYTFTIKSKTMEQVKVKFLEYLSERKEVSCVIQEGKILKNIAMCPARKLKLTFNTADREDEENQERFILDKLCEFLSKSKNVFQLELFTNLTSKMKEDSTLKLAQSLTQLKNLIGLNFELMKDERPINYNELHSMLNVIKNMNQLQSLYLKTRDEVVNEKIIPDLKRAINRLVTFNYDTQVHDRNY